jgi:hypothetical protein
MNAFEKVLTSDHLFTGLATTRLPMSNLNTSTLQTVLSADKVVSVYAKLVNNPRGADVVFLMGPRALSCSSPSSMDLSNKIYAHSAILATQSEYFLSALSGYWNNSVESDIDESSPDSLSSDRDKEGISTPRVQSPLTPPPESPHFRDRKHIVLKYPSDSPKTMLHALEFIYTGKTGVCESQLLDLASLADRFLMPELTRHCLEMYEGMV